MSYPSLQIKRVYEPPEEADGFRVLIDRLWPRGVQKEAAGIDLWSKEVSPSTELRKWFNHRPSKWVEFRKKYELELQESNAIDELIAAIQKHKRITLLYSARDKTHNNARALLQFLNQKLKR